MTVKGYKPRASHAKCCSCFFCRPEERRSDDLCARCQDSRKEHMQDGWYNYVKSGFSSGGGYKVPIFAVTSGTLSSCTAFIEAGEPIPKLGEPLPPRSQEFFDIQWEKVHGNKTLSQLKEEYRTMCHHRRVTPRAQ